MEMTIKIKLNPVTGEITYETDDNLSYFELFGLLESVKFMLLNDMNDN
ncbi:hypothetical protein [Ammoniphilus resinae]|uniref:Uncharacterized protein n=1 Tax=Ammoniphilus resinae TaxID=861532 RepID=A0ABS4GXL1_9BACL|nr:hypothetical protein [Ammoniphilus resinae]MBP1935013.1 hypothetical protein [Ammoniphilus resinae]